MRDRLETAGGRAGDAGALAYRERSDDGARIIAAPGDATFWQVMRAVEGEYLADALERAGGNKTAAARIAGLSYRTFLNRLENLNISVKLRVVVE